MVPKGGLEPPRVTSHAPQTCASTSSATSAQVWEGCPMSDKLQLVDLERQTEACRTLSQSAPHFFVGAFEGCFEAAGDAERAADAAGVPCGVAAGVGVGN